MYCVGSLSCALYSDLYFFYVYMIFFISDSLFPHISIYIQEIEVKLKAIRPDGASLRGDISYIRTHKKEI